MSIKVYFIKATSQNPIGPVSPFKKVAYLKPHYKGMIAFFWMTKMKVNQERFREILRIRVDLNIWLKREGLSSQSQEIKL